MAKQELTQKQKDNEEWTRLLCNLPEEEVVRVAVNNGLASSERQAWIKIGKFNGTNRK